MKNLPDSYLALTEDTQLTTGDKCQQTVCPIKQVCRLEVSY